LSVFFGAEKTPLPNTTDTCAYLITSRDITLTRSGTYLLEVHDSGHDEGLEYTGVIQCLSGCETTPPGGFPFTSISLTGCTAQCDPNSIFAATVTARRCPAHSELKIWFQLPDRRTIPVGSPHRELAQGCNFNQEVYRAVLPAAPPGTWRICDRLMHLNTGAPFAAACRAFTVGTGATSAAPSDVDIDGAAEEFQTDESPDAPLSESRY
jgi:hypothetical protein